MRLPFAISQKLTEVSRRSGRVTAREFLRFFLVVENPILFSLCLALALVMTNRLDLFPGELLDPFFSVLLHSFPA
jgi:hypothetical protein